MRKNYQLACADLLQVTGRENAGAEFYITRNVIDLNELTTELALVPSAS